MSFLQAKDAISGSQGRATATINGLVEDMFYVKKIEAKVEKTKAEVKVLGRRGTQNKATGWKGTGSMTIYYVTHTFRKMMLDYVKNGKDTYFDIQIVNEDTDSSIGKQTVVLKGVNLNSVVMASLDTGTDALEEEVEFTFEDVDIPDKFVTPTLG